MSRGFTCRKSALRNSFNANADHHQKGVGMLEILVALLILSIGFLAVARMQVESMRFSQSAYNRSQSYQMATDIVDRMRANVQGVLAGYYDGKSTNGTYVSPDCSTSTCTPEQVARQDLSQWREYLHPANDATALLPSSTDVTAAGTITANGANQYTVNIVWAEDGDSQNLNISFVAQGDGITADDEDEGEDEDS